MQEQRQKRVAINYRFRATGLIDAGFSFIIIFLGVCIIPTCYIMYRTKTGVDAGMLCNMSEDYCRALSPSYFDWQSY